MAEIRTFDDVSLPETKLYRVRGVGASYLAPKKAIGGDGQPTVIYTSQLAGGGQLVDLIAPEAERLEALGAVLPAEAPKGYDELSRAELEILATQRGVTVRSTGADSQNPLDDDYRNALALFDLGSDSALVGAAPVPGGVANMGADGVGPVLVDGIHPNPGTEQDAETHPVDEPAFAGRASAGFDARGKSASEVSDWITAEKPNAAATVAAAHGDADAARVVLEAESAASKGDPRQTVEAHLKRIAGE